MNSKSKKNPIIERVIQLRVEHFGKRGKSDFARMLNISPSTYNYYEQDRVPPAGILLKMCKATGAELEWLIAGEKIFANALKSFGNSRAKGDIGRAVEALAAENPKIERAICAFIEIICEKNNIKNPLASSEEFGGSGKNFTGKNAKKRHNNTDMNSKTPNSVGFSDRRGNLADETADGTRNVAGEEILNSNSGLLNNNNGAALDEKMQNPADRDLEEKIKGDKSLKDKGMIPVLGRTAAGIVHCWDQCACPALWHAETKLTELVKKYVGKDIVGSNSGEVEINNSESCDCGELDRNAYIVQVKADDEGIVEFVDSPDMAKRYPDCFGLRIDGDSMRPMIFDGDIVILSPSVAAKQGSVAVAKVKDQIGVTCKIIRFDREQVHLVADNENYETRVINRDQLVWALAVLGHVKKR